MAGLSAAGLRVLLKPKHNMDDDDEEMERELWSSKDFTSGRWKEANVLYTFNKEHQVRKKSNEDF
jgi:hypothetical protein